MPEAPGASPQSAAQPEASAAGSPLQAKSPEERKVVLAHAIQYHVARGARVESQADFTAVLVYGRPVNHTTHVLLSIFTCGLWLIPWLVLGLAGGERRTLLTVDDYGNALVQDLGRR